MRHQWESMEAATGPMSVWAHNFDNPHQFCPTSPVPNPISWVWARRVAAVWYSTFSSSERGNLQMGFRTLSAKVPALRPPDWSNMDSNGNNLRAAVWIPTRAWRSCRKKITGSFTERKIRGYPILLWKYFHSIHEIHTLRIKTALLAKKEQILENSRTSCAPCRECGLFLLSCESIGPSL